MGGRNSLIQAQQTKIATIIGLFDRIWSFSIMSKLENI